MGNILLIEQQASKELFTIATSKYGTLLLYHSKFHTPTHQKKEKKRSACKK